MSIETKPCRHYRHPAPKIQFSPRTARLRSSAWGDRADASLRRSVSFAIRPIKPAGSLVCRRVRLDRRAVEDDNSVVPVPSHWIQPNGRARDSPRARVHACWSDTCVTDAWSRWRAVDSQPAGPSPAALGGSGRCRFLAGMVSAHPPRAVARDLDSVAFLPAGWRIA